MSGAFSGQLIESYLTVPRCRPAFAPFGADTSSTALATSGPLSWSPAMHGSFHTQPSFALPDASGSFMDLSEASALKIAELQAKLDRKLGPEYISQRPGPGGGPKLTYAEGWKIINLANEVFGFNGWSSSVVSLTTDFIDVHEETRRYSVGVTAVVRITLRDGVYHEDVGYGILENSKSKGQALDKCKKEAVTDGIKRALRNFGNLLGNCLYDKEYAKEVVKIKVPPSKFDQSALHRRPEFQEGSSKSAGTAPIHRPAQPNPDVSTASVQPDTSAPSIKAESSAPANNARPAPPPQHQNRPMAPPPQRPVAMSTPKGKAPETATTNPPPFARPGPGAAPRAAAPPERKVTFQPAPPRPQAPAEASTSRLPPPDPVAAKEQFDDYTVEETQLVEELPAEDADDSFGMFNITSEDDAYLATMELDGIGELDKSVERDVNQDTSREQAASSETAVATGTSRPQARPVQRTASGKANRLNEIMAAMGGGSTSEKPAANPVPRPLAAQGAPSAGRQPTRPPTRPPTLPQARPLEQAHAQTPESRSSGTVGSMGTPRSRGPSMGGGFNFPSGFTPSAPRPPQSVAGTKRPADAMGVGAAGRRPVQGMGLSHGMSGGYGGQGSHAPQDSMTSTEGADAKRAKR